MISFAPGVAGEPGKCRRPRHRSVGAWHVGAVAGLLVDHDDLRDPEPEMR
jgi:hypothetical protein